MVNVSIVLPSYNEGGNLPRLISELISQLQGTEVEIVIVDDSTDNTPEVVAKLAEADNRIRLIHRPPAERTGLGSALLRGFAEATGTYILMMDADGQHPAEAARRAIELSRFGHDVVMPSRYINGGGNEGLDGQFRIFVSWALRMLPRVLFMKKLWRVTDPLGGIMLFKKEILPENLHGDSWKVALEVLLNGKYQSYVEIPYVFAERLEGESHASLKQGLKFFQHLFTLAKNYYITPTKTVELSEPVKKARAE